MSTKQKTIDEKFSCWNKAEDNEPVFVLRAKDPLAAIAVRLWASLNGQLGAHESYKSADALNVACAMDTWRREKYGDPQHDWGT